MTERILALVQAGGAGGRMDVLTRETAKPALPYAGVYRLVDLPLSNLAHSGVGDVWLSVAYQGSSLEEEVANGRPWDLDRTRGGLRLLMPEQGTGSPDDDGFSQGNADELYRLRDRIRSFAPDVLLVMSADHVYRLDHRDLVRTHLDRGASCTLVSTERPLDEAGDHLTVTSDEDGRVVAVAYKPEEPTTGVVAAEIVAYDPRVLVRTLEELHRELTSGSDPDSDGGDSGLGDFGHHLIPRLVERELVVEHRLPGYWRDLGTPEKYLAAHLELLDGEVDVFDDPAWPILTRQPQRPPGVVRAGAVVADAMVGPGCDVAGEVRHSVLGPGVRVARGAVVVDCVLGDDVEVAEGAHVERCVLDTGSRIGPQSRTGGPGGAVTLVGRDSRVAAGAVLAPGARLEPGTT